MLRPLNPLPVALLALLVSANVVCAQDDDAEARFQGPCRAQIEAVQAEPGSAVVILPTNEEDKDAEAAIHDYAAKVLKGVQALPDNEALGRDLPQHNITVFGTPEGNLWLHELLKTMPVRVEATRLVADREYRGEQIRFISVWPNPQNPARSVLACTAQAADLIPYILDVGHKPWDWSVSDGWVPLVVGYGEYEKQGDTWTFGPPQEVWGATDAGAVTFYTRSGESVSASAMRDVDEFIRMTAQALGTELTQSIRYYKHPDNASIGLMTVAGISHAGDSLVHSMFGRHYHEVVHALHHQHGLPPAFIGEGLAEFLTHNEEDGLKLSSARAVLDAGHWAPLSEIVSSGFFRRAPLGQTGTRAQAAAFMGWIMKEFGAEKVRALVTNTRHDQNADENVRAMEDAIGITLDEVDRRLQVEIRSPSFIAELADLAPRLARNREIFVMATDGSGATNVSRHPARDEGPIWSPDGRAIAFSSDRDGNTEIYTVGLEDMSLRRLTDDPALDARPAWSPDGTKIAFVSNRSIMTGVHQLDIRELDVTPLMAELGTWVLHAGAPAWSPDGSRVAYVARPKHPWEIHVMDLGTGESTVPYSAPPGTPIGGPDWSPDGKSIAFSSNGEDGWCAYRMASDGSELTKLADTVAERAPVRWSPTGAKLAFSSERDRNGEIYVMNAEGSEQTNLTNSPEDEEMPAWSPDGSKIAFVRVLRTDSPD